MYVLRLEEWTQYTVRNTLEPAGCQLLYSRIVFSLIICDILKILDRDNKNTPWAISRNWTAGVLSFCCTYFRLLVPG
jgi:hypothetical protein